MLPHLLHYEAKEERRQDSLTISVQKHLTTSFSTRVALIRLFVVLKIDNRRLELPSRDLAIEQDIDFAERPMLELWKEEVC